MLKPGIYEQVINKALGQELDAHAEMLAKAEQIDSEEASRVLTKYISEVIEIGLENVKDNGGNLQTQISLANKIVHTILSETGEAAIDLLTVDERAEQLLALFDRKKQYLRSQ